MPKKMMVVLYCYEGHVDIERMTKDDFLAKLAKAAADPDEMWHGKPIAPAGTIPDYEDRWNGLIVIDGDIVAPKPVKVVTEYTFEEEGE